MDHNKYLHSINLQTLFVCNNIAIPSPINSVLALNQYGFNQPMGTPLYDCNVDDLYNDPGSCFAGAVSPSFSILEYAAIFRRNLLPVNGFGQVMKFTDEQKRNNIVKADMEIDFERERQAQYRHKPSRLSSLFMVEDSEDGRLTLQNVFGDRTQNGYYSPHILDVKIILTMRIHRGDIRWLDHYLVTKDCNCITQYWEGAKFDKNARDEILLEGTLLPTNREQIEYVRAYGTFNPNYDHRRFWQDLDSPQYEQWFGNK